MRANFYLQGKSLEGKKTYSTASLAGHYTHGRSPLRACRRLNDCFHLPGGALAIENIKWKRRKEKRKKEKEKRKKEKEKRKKEKERKEEDPGRPYSRAYSAMPSALMDQTQWLPYFAGRRIKLLEDRWQVQETERHYQGARRSSSWVADLAMIDNLMARIQAGTSVYADGFKEAYGVTISQAKLRVRDGPPPIRWVLNILCSVRKLDG